MDLTGQMSDGTRCHWTEGSSKEGLDHRIHWNNGYDYLSMCHEAYQEVMPPGLSYRQWQTERWIHDPSMSAEQRELRANVSATERARERAIVRAREMRRHPAAMGGGGAGGMQQ